MQAAFLIITIALAYVATPVAIAADWRPVDLKNGNFFLIDLESVVKTGPTTIRAWVKQDDRRRPEQFAEIRARHGASIKLAHGMWLAEYDCQLKNKRILERILLIDDPSAPGELRSKPEALAASESKWSAVVPESTDEVILPLLCSRVRASAAPTR